MFLIEHFDVWSREWVLWDGVFHTRDEATAVMSALEGPGEYRVRQATDVETEPEVWESLMPF